MYIRTITSYIFISVCILKFYTNGPRLSTGNEILGLQWILKK